jgi:lipopolysaccharide transport system ATP-binding protein
MKPIIKVKNLSKQYRLGNESEARYATIRESLAGMVRAPLNILRRRGRPKATMWALKDVDLEIMPGEVVGIIGSNGAGKSTLLKILSRVTEPTSGLVELYGRVGSLLEVGTGFHPELTGRENIYLYGAILGMKRAEIARKFDEMVAFAEVSKFLDTPVKRYSSGMYVRLAFAVAAHLEPEILLVDEVLAVGDADFQKKCMGKMGDIAKEGRTVLLVSHNMFTISRLSPKTIWLDKGRIQMIGPSETVVSSYLSKQSASTGQYVCERDEGSSGGAEMVIRAIRIRDSEKEISATINAQRPFYIEIDYEVFSRISLAWAGFTMSTTSGMDVLAAADGDVDQIAVTAREPGLYTTTCIIPENLFNAGRYVLSVYAAQTITAERVEILTYLEHVLAFDIENPGGVGTYMPSARVGILSPKLHWEVRQAALENLAVNPRMYA